MQVAPPLQRLARPSSAKRSTKSPVASNEGMNQTSSAGDVNKGRGKWCRRGREIEREGGREGGRGDERIAFYQTCYKLLNILKFLNFCTLL